MTATPLRCFESRDRWQKYCDNNVFAKGPCVNCTPEFRQRMVSELRCDRPETIFVLLRGSVIGVSADDRRYGRILIAPEQIKSIGRAVEYNDVWATILEHVEPRAHKTVRRAITIWFRQYRKIIKHTKGNDSPL